MTYEDEDLFEISWADVASETGLVNKVQAKAIFSAGMKWHAMKLHKPAHDDPTGRLRDLNEATSRQIILNRSHVTDVCRVGQGETCCRYLVITADGGYICEKNGQLKGYLDARVRIGTLSAKGDNCEGVKNES